MEKRIHAASELMYHKGITRKNLLGLGFTKRDLAEVDALRGVRKLSEECYNMLGAKGVATVEGKESTSAATICKWLREHHEC